MKNLSIFSKTGNRYDKIEYSSSIDNYKDGWLTIQLDMINLLEHDSIDLRLFSDDLNEIGKKNVDPSDFGIKHY